MQVNDLKNRLAVELFGMKTEEAIEQNICISCKKPPKFNTKDGEAEYQLSALCEECFDEEFGDLV